MEEKELASHIIMSKVLQENLENSVKKKKRHIKNETQTVERSIEKLAICLVSQTKQLKSVRQSTATVKPVYSRHL